MEDKELYNKVMLIAFCIIVVLLGAGVYNKSRAGRIENYVPKGNAQEVEYHQGGQEEYNGFLNCDGEQV